MTTDRHPALPADATVAVIGAGTMGSGIALVAATAGHPVLLHDANAAAIDRGLGQLRAGLDRLVARGKIEPQERQARLARITPAPALDMLAPARLAIDPTEKTAKELRPKADNCLASQGKYGAIRPYRLWKPTTRAIK